MTPERWPDVERIYHEARERGPELRAAFVRAACGADSELLADVESLLGTDEGASAFLETSVLHEAARRLVSSGPVPSPGRIGRYEVLNLVGAGGMGEVYRARDPVLERDVALKLLLPGQLAGTDSAQCLLREAQSAARLSHPNICTVHEVGSFEGRPFLAMEYVEGETLAHKLRDGPLALDRVLDYGIQTARALAHAHERGLLHRDLKSSNIIVTSDHRIKVVDFGLAKLLSPSAIAQPSLGPSTSSRMLVGTPEYMSPEVLRGEPADVRSDVWAIGVLLYEMASGEYPFPGLTAFEVVAAMMAGPTPLLTGRVPPELGPVIQQCLAIDSAARFGRLTDVCTSLENVAAAAGTALRDGVPPPAGHDAGVKLRARAMMLAAAAAGLFAVVMAGWWPAGQRREAPRPVPAAESTPIRLAILPFEADATPGGRLLGLGLADSLITRLAGVGALQLRSTAAIRRFAGSHPDPKEAGRELGVDYLLYGAVASDGYSYEITLQLVRSLDGVAVWGDPFKVPQDRLPQLAELIGERVTSALEVPLTKSVRASLARRETSNAAAHLQYVTGRALMIQHEHPDRALPAFEKAVRLDPNYARAHTGLAHALARKYWHPEASENAAQYRARALQAAERALQIDPNLPEAHEALSTIYRYSEAEWDKTIEEGRKALTLDPRLEIPHHNMAAAFYHVGLFELSDQESLAGLKANADSRFHSLKNRARSALYDARFSAAEQLIGEINTSGDPGDSWLLAEARFYLGDLERTQQTLARLASGKPGVMADRAQASLATVLAFRGQRRAAETWVRRLVSGPQTDHHVSYRTATAYAQLGKPREAVLWLQRTVETGFPCYTWFMKDKLLDPVRQDPSFNRLMAQQRSDWEVRRARYMPVRPAF